MAKNNLVHILSCLSSIAICASITNAFSAGIDCSHANSTTEAMICNNANLQKLDLKLATVYSKVAKASNHKLNLQKKQKEWLLKRDRCGGETCLSDIYDERTLELISELRSLIAYKTDKVDLQALAELKLAIENRMKTDAEFPLESTLGTLEIKNDITSFSNITNNVDSSDGLHFPKNRPVGVTENEWAALIMTNIDGDGENGTASYTLLDIDGDGKRDLIIDSYIGGTGLFNYISVIPRKGDVFAGHYVSPLSDDADNTQEDGSLYSLNGRGSNQSATWIRLNGRVYAAYRNSYYGEDNVFLLRPFYINENMPKLTLHYQYTFSIPTKQSNFNESTGKSTDYSLDKNTHTALVKAIKFINNTKANSSGISDKPICPPPKNATEDERYGYSSYGPGHYSYEIIGDMPIWLNNTCYMGRLADWFGGYDKKGGLHTQLWMALPNAEKEEASFDVDARRKAVKIESGIGNVDFGGS